MLIQIDNLDRLEVTQKAMSYFLSAQLNYVSYHKFKQSAPPVTPKKGYFYIVSSFPQKVTKKPVSCFLGAHLQQLRQLPLIQTKCPQCPPKGLVLHCQQLLQIIPTP